MSTLGLYQTMTKLAKKLGGPGELFAAVAVGGYLLIRPVEGVIKLGMNKFKSKKRGNAIKSSAIYTVSREGKSNEGLNFGIGDTFRVLEQDGDAVLIEKIDDTNNPYFVALDFLKSISNYQ